MRALDEARSVCETLIPGLLGELSAVPLPELERAGNPALEIFRKKGGPALVIPTAYSGSGATPADALRVMRAIGSVAPSLAVASTMHHFSMATIFTLAESLRSSGVEWALLEAIATQNLLVSSGFAEGRPGAGILSPSVSAVRTDGGVIVNGAKRPCSMAASMDFLSASVAVPRADGDGTETLLLLVPADSPGISVHSFWATPILGGAESDEVRLTDVFVDARLITTTEVTDSGELDELQTVGFMWFEMLITACYLGMASALVERVIDRGKAGPGEIAALGIRLETATMLLDTIAGLLAAGAADNAALARATAARYGAQDAIVEAAGRAVEALGGIGFITDPDVAYLSAATQCVTFHPPSRAASRQALAAHFGGDILRIA
ncbi:acyl-CoA dehydrogenase [Nocardia sp. NPDC003482]